MDQPRKDQGKTATPDRATGTEKRPDREKPRAGPGQRDAATDLDGKVGAGHHEPASGRGSSQNEDNLTGGNPTDRSMVEPTGEATGDEGEETGRSGKTGIGRTFET